MENKPHGLDLGIKIESLNRKKKIENNKISSFQAMVEIDNSKKKGKLVFPMRSFNKNLLEWLWQRFSSSNVGIYTEGATEPSAIPSEPMVIASTSQNANYTSNAGIVLGKVPVDTIIANTTDIGTIVNHSETGDDGDLYYNSPYISTFYPNASNPTKYGFQIKRKFDNNDGDGGVEAYVLSLRGRTRKAGEAKHIISIDRFGTNDPLYVTIDHASSLTILFDFYITGQTATVGSGTYGIGGLTTQFMNMLKDLFFLGRSAHSGIAYNANRQVIKTFGIKAATNASNILNLIPSTTTTKEMGIVLMYNETDKLAVASGTGTLEGNTSNPKQIGLAPSNDTIGTGTIFPNLTCGTIHISVISLTGSKTTFYMYRDFTNDTSIPIAVTRAGIISGVKDAPNTPVYLLAMNRIYSNNNFNAPIYIAPEETLRITYTFSTEI